MEWEVNLADKAHSDYVDTFFFLKRYVFFFPFGSNLLKIWKLNKNNTYII